MVMKEGFVLLKIFLPYSTKDIKLVKALDELLKANPLIEVF